jgi:UDP-N-acetylmuramate dehydrogenase
MINYTTLEKLCVKHNASYRINELLAPYTTFKIGGACDFLIDVSSSELLREVVLYCKESNLPYRVLGNGSNVLVSDEGYRGVVLLLTDALDAGRSLTSLCLEARDNAQTGLEFAYGIPGTVGGAVYMNAGAYGGEIADVLTCVQYLDESGEVKTLERKDAEFSLFSYRKSPFTGTKSIIISAQFALRDGDKAQITAKMDDYMQRRKDKQPLEFPSAGSTFKRPEGDYASRLIDVCGLKELRVGGAEVSGKHAGFIINKGGATCNDVLELIEAVRERVYKETGIMLEREVEIWK